MERKLKITEQYLYIPVCKGKEEKKCEIFLEEGEKSRKKIYEMMVPAGDAKSDDYPCDYYAKIPVKQYLNRTFFIQADAPAAFLDGIKNEGKQPEEEEPRPLIHFTADTGWTNDPNGLIYADGVYHLYFQFNPFNIIWGNMSWGHAVSSDLLHWKQEDTVMFPDESGTMYSGCAITNERGMLGLPKDALLFFYTAAGGTSEWSRNLEFTQKIAYSLDGGRTLVKMPDPCLPTVKKENRDPKVYWHEETKAYIMALWIDGNDFAIFRSEDLMHWEESDRFTLDGAWECPDLFRLTSEEGETCWFFWAADGFYYQGNFDGYRFEIQGERQNAYINNLPYAAQTYFGVPERVISVPWLRIKNDGRMFTGTYGIPVELSCKKTADRFVLIQKPVRELYRQARRIEYETLAVKSEDRRAVMLEMSAVDDFQESYVWEINGSAVEYRPRTGHLLVDEEKYRIHCGYKEFLFIIDDRILEIFFDGGIQLGTFPLKETEFSFKMSENAVKCTAYEIK